MSTDSENSTLETTGTEPVFGRLGSIIRSLHDALRELGAEKVLVEAASEFPSARERLLHIAELTEKAANTVLTKVEDTAPIQDQLTATAKSLDLEWAAASLTIPVTFKPLAEKTTQFINAVQTGGETTRAALSDIMMAQDFQDLTGQLIKKVVTLLATTENDLLKLLLDAAPPGMVAHDKKDELQAGPGAPGSVALEQAGVDDLLADLGF
jgi:chemotaxis protein CheZ